MVIQINVTDKHAKALGQPKIVCGNSGYSIKFTFDAGWGAETIKTARFVYMARGDVAYTDVVFTGDTVSVPVLSNVREVRVGVFEGDLHTTTPAVIPCERSIRCGSGAPVDPTPSQYDQIMALLNNLPAGESDWNASEGEAGHIRNRTHYVDGEGNVHKLDNKYIDAEWMATRGLLESEEIFPQKEINLANGSIVSGFSKALQAGTTYAVSWNGEEYIRAVPATGTTYLGNAHIYDDTAPDTGEPFVLICYGGKACDTRTTDTDKTVDLRVAEMAVLPVKIPVDFLPDEVVKPFYFDMKKATLPTRYTTSVTVSKMSEALSWGRLIIARVPYPLNSPTMTLQIPLSATSTGTNGTQLRFIQGDTKLLLDPQADGTYTVAKES